VQDDRLPVAPVNVLAERLDRLAATGTRATRIDLLWHNVAPERPADPTDPSDPAYDFSRYDVLFGNLADRGISTMISVYDTPPWAAAGLTAEGEVNPATPDPGDFADFMQAVATRYSGRFVTPDGVELPEVRHIELWNEPNLSAYLAPQEASGERVALDAYAAMVSAAYPRIKDVNPNAIVIAGVAGPRGTTSDSGTGVIQWIRGLAARGIPLDAYSQHIYPAAPPTRDTPAVPSWATIDLLLAEIDRFEPGLPLYITEAGYTTDRTPYRDSPGVSDDEQAQYLREMFELPQVQNPRVAAIVWFNFQDNPNWPAGLIRFDGSEKPSLDAFEDVAEERARPLGG
jgi:hypothetical protein